MDGPLEIKGNKKERLQSAKVGGPPQMPQRSNLLQENLMTKRPSFSKGQGSSTGRSIP